MGILNRILTSANAYLGVTNLAGAASGTQQLDGLPLGTSDGTATGEIAVKVINVGYSTAGGTTVAISTEQGTAVVSTAGTAVAVGSDMIYAESVEFHARKNKTTANTGNVYVGFSSSASGDLRVLAPGESWSISAVAGKKIALHSIYVDAATNGDAVTYTAVN